MRNIVFIFILVLGVNVIDVLAQVLHRIPCLHAALLGQGISNLRAPSANTGVAHFVIGEKTLPPVPKAGHLAGAPHVDPPHYAAD